MATPSKGKDEQDNPIYFTGDLRDWQAFKQELQSLADRKDYSWLFDTGKALCDFYVSQVRDKTGTASRRKTALAQELNPKPDGNHVPTEVKAYKTATFDNWFDEDVDGGYTAITDVLLALNKHRLLALGSNFTDHKKLGYANEGALARAHKQVDLKYLKTVNRMATRLLHDAVFTHPQKETTGRRKLLSILQTNEVKDILAATPFDDKDLKWIQRPWEIPAVQLWARIMYKYEGMQEALSGNFMDELATTINCVTGDARHCRTI